jgi:hypothetical protein
MGVGGLRELGFWKIVPESVYRRCCIIVKWVEGRDLAEGRGTSFFVIICLVTVAIVA